MKATHKLIKTPFLCHGGRAVQGKLEPDSEIWDLSEHIKSAKETGHQGLLRERKNTYNEGFSQTKKKDRLTKARCSLCWDAS